jgi:hypothetical protein
MSGTSASTSPLLHPSTSPLSRPKQFVAYWRNLAFGRKAAVLVCLFVLVVFSSGAMYLSHTGAFDKVDRNIRIENGTAYEPNTGLAFPVLLKRALDGSPKTFHLIGVFLQARRVPEIEATLKVFVLAHYVEQEQGRKQLRKFRGKLPQKGTAQFTELVDTLSKGDMAVACEYRMLMSPPGSHMHDAWVGSLAKWWQARGLTSQHIEALSASFTSWFAHFRNHDDFWWEFDNIQRPNGPTLVQFNAKNLKPCADPEMGMALAAHELLENGALVLNLLPTLFD